MKPYGTSPSNLIALGVRPVDDLQTEAGNGGQLYVIGLSRKQLTHAARAIPWRLSLTTSGAVRAAPQCPGRRNLQRRVWRAPFEVLLKRPGSSTSVKKLSNTIGLRLGQTRFYWRSDRPRVQPCPSAHSVRGPVWRRYFPSSSSGYGSDSPRADRRGLERRRVG